MVPEAHSYSQVVSDAPTVLEKNMDQMMENIDNGKDVEPTVHTPRSDPRSAPYEHTRPARPMPNEAPFQQGSSRPLPYDRTLTLTPQNCKMQI